MKIPNNRTLALALAVAALLLDAAEFQPAYANIWVTNSSMHTARYGHTATLLTNGMVLVAGGGYNVGYFNSAELYDPVTKSWAKTGSMAANRSLFTATLLTNGKVLVAGGLTSQGIYNHSNNGAEIYDPTTGTWKTTGSMATARYAHTATLLPNGKVLVTGGIKDGSLVSSAELYDPATETWSDAGSMTVPRSQHTATLLNNGTVLVAGGIGLSSAELYYPPYGTWTPTGSMSDARRVQTATLLTNGKVLVAGGINSVGAVLSSAEVYDPDTGNWTPVRPMATGRSSHTATLLPNGNVLVAGGDVSPVYVAFTNSAELYKPATGTWVAGGAMNAARSGHTATLLPDGSLLVAGGETQIGNNVDAVSSTELYVKAPATVTLGNLVQSYDSTSRSVSVSTAPPGLTVDVTYNGLTNAPSNPGSYTVIGTIDDPDFQGSATNTLVITPPPPPTIIAGPTNQVLATGGTLTLCVTAGGFPPPAYQWFKDSRRLLGATNSTLAVTNADVTYSGTYYVAVTNLGGMVISLPVRVAVGNPTLMAWGKNCYGQLGNGTASGSPDPYDGSNPNPSPVAVAINAVTGAAGEYHSLFVTADGTLLAMGWNPYGQLGNGTTTDAHTPVSVANNVVAVAAGRWHSLFVTGDGTLWAMGYNYYGQLGNGGNYNSSYYGQTTPVSVASQVVAVAAGGYHSLFIKTDGTLWAMGFNGAGQLGNGDPTGLSVLTPIFVASNVVMVAAGFVSSQFVKTDGTLWTMGENYNGELGIGTSDSNSHPVPVRVANNVVAVASGGDDSLFVTSDGTLWAMGDNWAGQLGNGDPTDANVLTPASVASNVVAVAAGNGHSLFVKTDGTLWAMGENVSGVLGVGTTFFSTNLPVIVPHLYVANVSPADEAFHSLAVGRIQATVTLGNLNQTYTGSAISVSVSTLPPGLTVNLTYNDSPATPTNAGSYTVIGTISDPAYFGSATNILVINQAATTTRLTNVTEGYFFPGQSLTATYSVSPVAPGGGTPTGTVTLTNELSAVSGPAPAGTLTMLLTNVGTFHFTATYSGDANFLPSSSSPPVSRTVLSMTNPAASTASLLVSSGTRFLQTSLMQQLLTITNITSQPLAAVRVTIHLSAADLTANIIVYDASGTNSAGEPYLQYNYPVPPGGQVTLTAEYYSPDRVTVPHPTFTVELVTPEILAVPPGTPLAVLRPPVVLPPDNAMLIDFATEAGATYYILYKDDFASTNWNVAQPPVTGTGYNKQWVDDGPPKTESPPSSVPQRYYEVLKAK